MHKCDTPACVNHDHLVAATQLDNIADRVRKGRSSGGSNAGESSPQSKLTRLQAETIIRRRQNGETFLSISRDYPVSVGQVRRIALGERWNKGG
jgi:DNA invertase Pin-like site-specific DNA recombinase